MSIPPRRPPQAARLIGASRRVGLGAWVGYSCAAALVLTTSCGTDEQVAECNRLVDAITNLHASVKWPKAKPGDELADADAALRASADSAAARAADIGSLDLSTPPLQEHAQAYQTMVEEIAKTARDVAAVATDVAKLAGASRTAQGSRAATRTAIELNCKVDRAPEGCTQVKDALSKAPPPHPEAAYPAALATFASDLEKLEVKHDALRDSVKAHVAAVRAHGKALGELHERRAEGERLTTKLDEVTAAEAPLVEKINAFCSGG